MKHINVPYLNIRVCDAAVYKSKVDLKLPVARRLLRKSMLIPMHENMIMEQAEYVVDCITKFYG